MAGTILVREALRRVSQLLNDLVPAQFQRHTQVDCVHYLNDAALAIVKFLPSAGSRLDAVRLVPGTRQSIQSIPALYCKPGDGSTPAVPILGINVLRVTRNMGALGLTPGRAVRVLDSEMLDASEPDWHLASKADTVVTGFTQDPMLPHYYFVSPPVHATTQVWVELAYNAQPLKIPNVGSEDYTAGGVSAALIQMPDEYIDDLVNYVVARANMVDSEWADGNKASYFGNQFLSSLNAKVAALTGTNPNLKRLPFAPAPVGAAA